MEESDEITMKEKNDNSINDGLEVNFFVNHKTVKEMVIFEYGDFSLTLEDIINLVKDKNAPFKEPVEKFFQLELNVYYIDEVSFSFKIEKVEGIDILRKPIKYKTENEEYEFVAIKQFNLFLDSFSLPMIKCNETNQEYEPTFSNFVRHMAHQDKIIESFKYIYYHYESDYINFFEKYKKKYTNKEFETALDFDKNFNYYFNYKENLNLNEKFFIYEGEFNNRRYLQMEILDNTQKEKRLIYYGISGKGKSVSLIGSLKYRIDFSLRSTLYINCKTLKYLLIDKKISTVKQLLIDEIIFLTSDGNFAKYISIVHHIKYFNFKNEYDFWVLILEIIVKFCSDKKQYVFGLDQYNDSNDYYGYLKKLKDFCNNKDNIKLVIFSSMNESDVRNIKINKLFYDNPKSPNEKYIELDNICNIKEISKTLNFEQIEIWQKFGCTMKSLMEIKSSSDLKEYLKQKKIKLTYKIISFYAPEKEIDFYYNRKKDEIIQIPSEVAERIVSFSTDYNYERNEILEVISNIPFRYFDIIKKGNGFYKINLGFSLVGEVMNLLYRFIVLKCNYETIKKALKNKGSGLGTIFEMKVVFRLFPNINKKNIFNNFTIDEHIQIESIVKRFNETKKNVVKKLKNDTNYIIEQKNYGGKDLDCLIINMIDSIPYVYGFQISIYKPDIFGVSYLKDSFTEMIKNISKTFKIQIEKENTYFGYIFDYSRIEDPEYSSMLDDCTKNNHKFCFFETKKEIFCDRGGKVINDINEITNCPFNKKQRVKSNIINSDNNLLINPFLKDIPNENLLRQIVMIISKDLNISINKLNYQGEQNGPKISKNKINIKMLDSNTSILIIYTKNESFIAKVIKNNEIQNYNSIEYGKYHIYEII